MFFGQRNWSSSKFISSINSATKNLTKVFAILMYRLSVFSTRSSFPSRQAARKECQKFGAQLASTLTVGAMWKMVAKQGCRCGWISDGSINDAAKRRDSKYGSKCPRLVSGKCNEKTGNVRWIAFCFQTSPLKETGIKTGKVFLYQDSGTAPVLTNKTTADLGCKSMKPASRLATSTELQEAEANGMALCACGWLADNKVDHKMDGATCQTGGKRACSSLNIHQRKRAPIKNYNAYCFLHKYEIGYEFCSDIDECARKPNVCGQNAQCVNTEGAYECKAKHKTDL